MFHPIPAIERDIDLLYVARFTSRKRPDMALACVRFVAERNPATRSVFLESYASESALRTQIRQLAKDAGLTANLEFRTVLTDQVNGYMNRARLCLFTSDEEGLCRATLQTLLAERPLLAYRNTRALTRHLYDDRFFHFYEDQSPDSIGQTAWNLLCKPVHENPGARNYLLQEKGFVFHDLPGWQAELLAAAAPLYARDGQTLNHTDVIRVGAATSFILWRNFHLQRDPAR
jgi:glycosyltransferase involved in cell wall biosynthesis